MNKILKVGSLLAGDVVVLYLSLTLAVLTRSWLTDRETLLREHLTAFSVLFFVWLIIFYSHRLYDLTAAKNTLEFYTTLLRAVLANAVLAVLLFYFIPFFAVTPKIILFIFLAFFLALFAAWRQFINRTLKIHFNVNAIIVGKNERALELAAILNSNPQIGYSARAVPRQELDVIFSSRGRPDVQTVIVEEKILASRQVSSILYRLIEHGVEVIDFESFEEGLRRKVRLEKVDELWFLKYAARGRRHGYDFLKRALDVGTVLFFSVPAIVLGIFIALAIKLGDRGPVLFHQKRIGQNERPFTLIKFRTMVINAEKDGVQWTKENDPRITPLGRFLRKSRLDELPQFINILRGEVSFVGPRSERPEFHEILKKEIPFYDKRSLIKPGFTGWAQINYPYGGASVEETREKLAYDFYYIKHRSLLFDVGIIARTIELVLSYRGR